MRRVRVIPLLMIDSGRAVITRKFRERIYVGDPVNAIKILNDKEIDELIVLDITKNRAKPDFNLVSKLASESFMPFAYGGHLTSVADAEQIIKLGVEKVSFNRALQAHPEVIREMAHRYGSQSIIVSVDISKNWLNKKVVRGGGNIRLELQKAVQLGAGEILLTAVDRDGMMTGYDYEVIRLATASVNVPVVACGGASSLLDFRKAIGVGASAVAAGAMFYFKGGQNSILINYPNQQILTEKLYSQL